MDNSVNPIFNITALMAFIGGRYIITDFYNKKPDFFKHPMIKILILISILYMNIKDLKLTIFIFFVYVFFIENHIMSDDIEKNSVLDGKVQNK
jgi:hypothetical protein